MKAVILCAGRGTRLGDLTKDLPKPMVPINGKPLLEYTIQYLSVQGFKEIAINLYHKPEKVKEYFGDGNRFDVRIDYLREQSPLGTAGALGFLKPHPSTSFVVSNGDVITDVRYGELLDFHIRHNATATMAVRQHEWQHPFGVVQTEGVDIVGFEEKPIARSHINAGVYALAPEALSELSTDEHCDMPTLFERLHAKSKRTVAYPMHEPWLDVGRPDDLNSANDHVNVKDRK